MPELHPHEARWYKAQVSYWRISSLKNDCPRLRLNLVGLTVKYNGYKQYENYVFL